MELNDELCWRAWSARDARFAGRFVMGVTSTHIYCRPGCPARLPDRRHARFYPSPAAAEAAGFRACRRCRPELAPGAPAGDGTAATVSRALRLIDDGALTHGSLEALAERLGVTSRWLRALFERHVGASPLGVARSRRAHFARRLLSETTLPLEDVAAAAGYGSARRLRAALHATFRRAPSELRARRASARPDGALALRLPARAPFDPAPLLAFFAARAVPGVERVERGTYARAFVADGEPGVLAIEPDRGGVTLRVPVRAARALPALIARATRMFDLEADADGIAAQLARDPRLARALDGRAVRLPGAFDAFEAGVRALLGQQVSVAAARTLAARLAHACGMPLGTRAETDLTHAFPDAPAVAAAPLDRLGLTRARADALRSFAHAVADGTLDLRAFRDLDAAVAALVALPGFGDWTAHYVAMRALGEPDAFPAGDLGVRKALARAGRLPGEREARRRAERWRPWRAYAVVALWSEHPPAAVRARRGPKPEPLTSRSGDTRP